MWKILAVAIYAGVLLVIGYLASKRMHDIRDYFASGKRLGFINVAFSARATGESAWLLLGLTGMGYAVGVNAFWVVLGEMLGVGGAWLFMARRFKRLTDRYDSITIPDYLESRFRDNGHWIRLISVVALLVFVPIYAGTQVHASGGAFFSFLGIPHFLGATIGFAIVLLYITQGGFTAVVWSDVFQGALMFLGLVAMPLIVLLEVGGVTHILEALRAADPDLLSLHGTGPTPEGVFPAVAGSGGWNLGTIVGILGLVAIGIGFWGSPQIFVRFISIRSEKEIAPGAATALIWTILADSGAVLVGITGRAVFTWADLAGEGHDVVSGVEKNILPMLSVKLLPAFFAGVYIAMVLSAIMSTIDSLLILASSAAVRDYWQMTRRPDMSDERLVRLSRMLTIALSLVAFAIGIGIMLYDKDQGIFWTIIFGWNGIAATFCPVMILSLFWSKLTALGARWAMVAGFLGVPIFEFAVPPALSALGWSDGAGYLNALDSLLPSFLVGFVVAVVVSLLDKRGQARLEGVAQELKEAGA
ncbi:MAG: sodium/proline symporter [Phycisphaerales bacterium]